MSVAARPPWRRWTLAAVVIVAVGMWWSWPTVARHDDPDVLVVDDGFLTPGRRSLELRTRESGRSVRWEAFDPEWCDDPGQLADRVREVAPGTVVLAVPCAAALAPSLDARAVVVVAEPGRSTSAPERRKAGYAVVDPERLVGPPDPDVRLPCEWWEQCDGDGLIAVRDPAGALTPAAQERAARMIVAAL